MNFYEYVSTKQGRIALNAERMPQLCDILKQRVRDGVLKN